MNLTLMPLCPNLTLKSIIMPKTNPNVYKYAQN